MRNLIWSLGLALALLWPSVVFGVGQEVGRLVGQVTEAQTGAPVPGANVTASGRALIGPPRRTVTDDDGRYEIGNLPPGPYQVEVSYAGVKPLRKRVEVEASVATPLNITWSAELAQAETTTVIEERHLTHPDTPVTEFVLPIAEKGKYTPIGQSYQSVIGQAPGVIGTGNANVRGGTSRSNRFRIDGLDITDVASNTFRGNWQFDAAAQIQVLTGGFEAKYNAIGSITNIITRSGSDEFHFDITGYWQPSALQSFLPAGRQSYDELRPYADDPKPAADSYEVSMTADGPIIKHKLWFSTSFRYSYATTVQPAGPPLNKQAPNRLAKVYQPRAKLTWAPSASHRIMVQFLADPTKFDFVNNNGSAANTNEPLAAQTQNQGGWHIMGEWDYFISRNLDTKLLLGFQHSGIDAGPQGRVNGLDPKYGIYDFNRPQHTNSRDGSVWGNQLAYSQDTRPKFQLDFAVAWRTRLLGLHEFEAGFNGLFSKYTVDNIRTGNGATYSDNTPTTGELLDGSLCDEDPYIRRGRPDPDTITGVGCRNKTITTSYHTATFNYNFGLYIQDRWKPVSWLTLLPGVRWDFYQDRLEKTMPLAYGDGITLYGFGPRFGAIFDLTRDQKTILGLFYGRATQAVYAQAVTNVDITNKQTTTDYTWNNTTKMFETPQMRTGPGTAYLDTKNHTPPHSDEVLVRLSREVFKNSVAEVEYSYRKISNIFEAVETNRIWDASGNRVIGYVNPDFPNPISLSTYRDSSYTKYSGVSLIFETRPSQHFDFQGSYTLSWTYGPASDENLASNQYANPRQSQYYAGWALDIDTRHQFKTLTSYNYRGLIIGVLFNWSSGTPGRKVFTPISTSLASRFRAPFGTEPGAPINDSRSWAEFRTPAFFNLGINVGYDFFELIKQHVIVTVRLTNVLDLETPDVFNRNDNDLFGTVSSRVTPRRVTLGLEYKY